MCSGSSQCTKCAAATVMRGDSPSLGERLALWLRSLFGPSKTAASSLALRPLPTTPTAAGVAITTTLPPATGSNTRNAERFRAEYADQFVPFNESNIPFELPPRSEVVELAAQAFFCWQGPKRDGVSFAWGPPPWAPSPTVSTVCPTSLPSVAAARVCVDGPDLLYWGVRAATGQGCVEQKYKSGSFLKSILNIGATFGGAASPFAGFLPKR